MSVFNKITLTTFLIAAFVFSVFAQQTERDRGIELYKKSDFNAAATVLKKSVKSGQTDAQSWYFLGLSYLKIEEEKNAVKALQKAVQISPNDAPMRNVLAYAYLVKNDLNNAYKEAQEAIKLDSKTAESHYIIGVVSFRNGSYNSAYEKARKAVEINPRIATAYLLKSESLIASFTKQYGTVNKSSASRSEMLKEAEIDLQKFLSLIPDSKDSKFYTEYLNSIRFFADYYVRMNDQLPKSDDAASKTADSVNALKINYKPRASYTDAARRAGVSGTVTLLVGFAADGKIKHVLLLNPLGYGLNEEAVKAAQNIRYDPAVENGKPVSVVKQVQYSFTIY